MARTFASGDKVRTNIGGCNVDAGPSSVVAIIKTDASRDSNWRSVLCGLTSAGAPSGWNLEISSADKVAYGNGASDDVASSDPGTTAASGWVLVAGTKATGSVHPRLHRYSYSGNSWFHAVGNSVLVADGTAPGSSGFVEIGGDLGGSGDNFVGDIAVAGFWGRELSDVEIENLAFSLTAWYAGAPSGMWVLDQSATGQKVVDFAGGGANESSITGTSVSTSSVPILNYADGVWMPTIVTPGGGSIKTLTGTANVTFTESASIVRTRVLSSTANLAFTESASIVRTRPLAATANLRFTEAATLVATHVFSPSVTIAFTETVNLVKTTSGAVTRIVSGIAPAILKLLGKWN